MLCTLLAAPPATPLPIKTAQNIKTQNLLITKPQIIILLLFGKCSVHHWAADGQYMMMMMIIIIF
jgi:hypothetical protein